MFTGNSFHIRGADGRNAESPTHFFVMPGLGAVLAHSSGVGVRHVFVVEQVL